MKAQILLTKKKPILPYSTETKKVLLFVAIMYILMMISGIISILIRQMERPSFLFFNLCFLALGLGHIIQYNFKHWDRSDRSRWLIILSCLAILAGTSGCALWIARVRNLRFLIPYGIGAQVVCVYLTLALHFVSFAVGHPFFYKKERFSNYTRVAISLLAFCLLGVGAYRVYRIYDLTISKMVEEYRFNRACNRAIYMLEFTEELDICDSCRKAIKEKVKSELVKFVETPASRESNGVNNRNATNVP